MKENEVWKDVVGFEEYFQVSNFGSVFSKRTGRILRQTKSKSGYAQVSTRIGGRDGIAYCFKIHRLVADAFISKPQYLIDQIESWVYQTIPVNHIDGNKLNNHISNLEWCSYKENSKHAIDNGLFTAISGCDTYNSKFTAEQVLYIREVYKPYDKIFGARPLAQFYNVHHTVISRIARKLKYKTVD